MIGNDACVRDDNHHGPLSVSFFEINAICFLLLYRDGLDVNGQVPHFCLKEFVLLEFLVDKAVTIHYSMIESIVEMLFLNCLFEIAEIRRVYKRSVECKTGLSNDTVKIR